MWDKVILTEGEALRVEGSRSRGCMGETDITHYSIVDSAGKVTGTVELTEHTAIKTFLVTKTLIQKDALGKVVLSVQWNP